MATSQSCSGQHWAVWVHPRTRGGGHSAEVPVGNQRVPDAPLARSAGHQDAQPAHLAGMPRHALGQQAGPPGPRDGGARDRQHDGVTALLDHAYRVQAARQLQTSQTVPEVELLADPPSEITATRTALALGAR